jgi:hypothetical protein
MRMTSLMAAASLAASSPVTALAYSANIQNLSLGANACPMFEVGAPGQHFWADDLMDRPLVVDLVAGGDLDLTACPDLPWVGHVVENPDLTITLGGLDALGVEFYVRGDCDTVLLVNAADGTWHYSDDFEQGIDPLVDIDQAPSGQYDIWIGTYGTDTCEATLFVGAYDPVPIS